MKLNTYDLPVGSFVTRRIYTLVPSRYIIITGYDKLFNEVEDLAAEITDDPAAVFVDDAENIFSVMVDSYTYIPRGANYDFEIKAELLDNFDTFVVTSL